MKTIQFIAIAAAAVGMIACCNKAPKQFSGFIADASMNTVVVRAAEGEAIQSFATDAADLSAANGMLLGAPIVVDYVGCLEEVTPATKIATDATYAEAIGDWTMADPINDSLRMGVKVMVEGAAESINMATMPYTSWSLQGEANKIILNGESIGNGERFPVTQTAILSKRADGIWTMTIEGTEVVMTKSN